MTVAGVGGQDRRRPLGTEAREMLTHAPALSVASPDAIADCMVIVTFTPCTPIGATAVAFSPDLGTDHVGLLDLLDDCIARLVCYRTDYAAAMAQDQGDPLS